MSAILPILPGLVIALAILAAILMAALLVGGALLAGAALMLLALALADDMIRRARVGLPNVIASELFSGLTSGRPPRPAAAPDPLDSKNLNFGRERRPAPPRPDTPADLKLKAVTTLDAQLNAQVASIPEVR